MPCSIAPSGFAQKVTRQQYSTASEATGWHTQRTNHQNLGVMSSVPSGRFARGTVLLACFFLCKAAPSTWPHSSSGEKTGTVGEPGCQVWETTLRINLWKCQPTGSGTSVRSWSANARQRQRHRSGNSGPGEGRTLRFARNARTGCTNWWQSNVDEFTRLKELRS